MLRTPRLVLERTQFCRTRVGLFAAVAVAATVASAQGARDGSFETRVVAALPPQFDTAVSARIEQTQLAVAIPIDLNWGLP